MNKQKKKAKEFVKKYRLTPKSLTAKHVKDILKAMGFKLYAHNKYGYSSQIIQQLLDSLGLSEYSLGKNAFTYISSTNRLIFFYRQLSEEEILYTLLHEVGHIICQHHVQENILAYNDLRAEREANEFALYVYKYAARNKIKRITLISSAILLSLGVLFSAFCETHSTPTESAEKEVYITKSGKCYHKAGCSYVLGKRGIFSLTEKEAKNAGYVPCSYCKPEMNN